MRNQIKPDKFRQSRQSQTNPDKLNNPDKTRQINAKPDKPMQNQTHYREINLSRKQE